MKVTRLSKKYRYLCKIRSCQKNKDSNHKYHKILFQHSNTNAVFCYVSALAVVCRALLGPVTRLGDKAEETAHNVTKMCHRCLHQTPSDRTPPC